MFPKSLDAILSHSVEKFYFLFQFLLDQFLVISHASILIAFNYKCEKIEKFIAKGPAKKLAAPFLFDPTSIHFSLEKVLNKPETAKRNESSRFDTNLQFA